jgi:hypothetical protein
MKRLQYLIVAIGAVVFALTFAQPAQALLQTLQSQIAITIFVNVSPAPVGYAPPPSTSGSPSISTSIALGKALPGRRTYRAEALRFTGDSTMIAQAQVQHGNLVQAEVSPNPKATLLYSNLPSVGPYTITAGTTKVEPCAFEVVVDAAKAWTLDEGVTSDFTTGFPGNDVGNNTYLSSATPKPTATPYAVYADDGNAWTLLSTGGVGMTTYCVTLTITVPASVTAGPYSTNAIYSIYQ